MEYRVVPLTEALIPGFHSVLDTVAREKCYLAFLEAPPLEETTAFVRTGLQRGFPHFVALAGDRVVGWCDISPLERPAYAHCGTLGIGLLAEYRRKGMGMALMLAALEKARAIGLTRVELAVRERNTNATALYESLGFRHEGRKRNAVRVDGAYENLLGMALLFDDPV